MKKHKFKPGDRVVAKFVPIDPEQSTKPKDGCAKGSVLTKEPLTIRTTQKRDGGLGPLLIFEGKRGVFDSCYFFTEEEARTRDALNTQSAEL